MDRLRKVNKLGEVSGHNSCDAFVLLLALWLPIIIIIIITCMHGIYSLLHIVLFHMLNMFCTFTLAVCSAQYGCFL
jgi:hypothetical protein